MKITSEERQSVATAGRITEAIKEISSKPATEEGSDEKGQDLSKLTSKLITRRAKNIKKQKDEEEKK